MRRFIALIALSTILLAACRCPFYNADCPFGHKGGIQQPQMTPEDGTYKASSKFILTEPGIGYRIV